MKQGDNYILTTIIDGQTSYRQEACMGGYWGFGDHIEIFGWIDPFKSTNSGAVWGSMTEIQSLCLSDDRPIFVRQVRDFHDYNPNAEVTFVVRPNFWTRLAMIRKGFGWNVKLFK